MDMTFSNKAMQPLSGFGIQFNKNSFGLAPAQPLNVPAIPPNQACAYIWTLRKLSPGFIAISHLFYSSKTNFELELLEIELGRWKGHYVRAEVVLELNMRKMG